MFYKTCLVSVAAWGMLMAASPISAAFVAVTDGDFEASGDVGSADLANNDTDHTDNTSGWYEQNANVSAGGSQFREFAKNEDGGGSPPSDGNDASAGVGIWGALGNNNTSGVTKRIYQQIGTWEANQLLQISFLAGDQGNTDFGTLTVELFRGGDKNMAADGIKLDTGVGATLIDSFDVLASDFAGNTSGGTALTLTVNDTLDTGAAGTAGEALWLAFSSPADGDLQLIDTVEVVPEPASLALFALGVVCLKPRRSRD